MTSKKSDVKQVLRQHYPWAFLNAPKQQGDGMTYVVPSRASLAGTRAHNAITLIVDLSIYANMFMNVVANPDGPGKVFVRKSGAEFVKELTKNIDEGFAEGYRNIVLVLDKECHTTEAKALTQKARSESAEQECKAAGLEPIDWIEDDPTDLVTYDGIMQPMCSIKCVRSAFRYALYQAMGLALSEIRPPPGCRVCFDVQEYAATNPSSLDNWLNHRRIRIQPDSMELIESLRKQLRGRQDWRAKTRELSTELGRKGAYSTVPWVIECTPTGVLLEPIPMTNCANTSGEADQAVWRWVNLFFGANVHRAMRSAERRTAAEQMVYSGEIALDQGPACVATRDSDFIVAGLVATAALLCDYAHGESKPRYDIIDKVGALAPFLLIGESYVTEHGYAKSIEQYGTSTEIGKPQGRAVRKSYEMLDMHRFFCAFLFNRYPFTHKLDNDDLAPMPLPPLDIERTTPHDWLRRTLTLLAYRSISGNDFLKGLGGISHATMWRALVLMLTAYPTAELVHFSRAFVRPLDAERGALPSQAALVLHPDVYCRYLTYCYWTSIEGKGGNFAPTLPASMMTLDQVAALVRGKWKNKPSYHVPKPADLALMYERALWSIYYELYGPHSVRRTLCESVIGWYEKVKNEKV